jgi:hypothetical protein
MGRRVAMEARPSVARRTSDAVKGKLDMVNGSESGGNVLSGVDTGC